LRVPDRAGENLDKAPPGPKDIFSGLKAEYHAPAFSGIVYGSKTKHVFFVKKEADPRIAVFLTGEDFFAGNRAVFTAGQVMAVLPVPATSGV
jgi:hypothetical protein